MRVLVTGGCGFIGNAFVRLVLRERPDWDVLNLDLLTYAGNPDTVADLAAHPRYGFLQADVADGAAVARAMDGCAFVVHFAAESHVDRSISGPAAFTRTNVVGTQTLLDAARAASVQRFLQVSTDEVYGDLGPTGAFTETNPIKPSSPYSASKASADLMALAYHRTFGMDVCVTRCSNNYGPYQYPEKLIPFFFLKMTRGEKLPVYGDGQQVRDWLFVEDHVEAILTVLEKGRAGSVYNIGGNCERTNLQITEQILAFFGRDGAWIQHVADRPGHDRRYAIDAAKIGAELGWKPRFTFEEALPATLRWYQQHGAWIDSCLLRAAKG